MKIDIFKETLSKPIVPMIFGVALVGLAILIKSGVVDAMIWFGWSAIIIGFMLMVGKELKW